MGLVTSRGTTSAPFAFLWAFALLSHQVGYEMVAASPLDAALTVSALAVMVLPEVPLLLAVLAAVHGATVFQHLPFVFHHWYFSSLVSLAIVLASVSAWVQSRSGSGARPLDPFWAAFAPAGRWSLVILYFISGFHKLNTDFFDPEVSCALVLFEELGARLGGVAHPEELGPLLMGATVAVELGLPTLLVVPRLRRAGVVLGVLFHLTLALAGYPRFSAIGIALLALFLPAGLPAVSPVLRAVAVAVLLPGVLFGSLDGDALFLWATIAIGAAVVEHASTAGPGAQERRPAEAKAAWAAQLASALVLLSGINPYIGLNTNLTFSMYSNLRTEGGDSNHLLVPVGAQIFSYQRDLVQVTRSSSSRLDSLATRGVVIPAAELQALLSEEVSRSSSPVSVEYHRGGVRYAVPSAADDATLGLPLSALRTKLLRFRPIEPLGPRRCTA
jgi:hypothetical protein